MQTSSAMNLFSLVLTILVVQVVAGAVLWFAIKPGPRLILIYAASLVVMATVATLLYRAKRPDPAIAELQQSGVRGTATVLRVQGTNRIVNRRPEVVLLLRIEIPGTPPLEREVTALVPIGQSVAPQRQFAVLADPGGAGRVHLEWESAPSASQPEAGRDSLAARLAQLDEARKQGLITDDEYRQQRERLLSQH